MPYCIELSDFDHSRQKIVSGPWEGECKECSFLSSSSSSLNESGFFACFDGECVSLSELDETELPKISLGPFFGTDDCSLCTSSSSSLSGYSSSSSHSSSSSGMLSCLECDPEKKAPSCDCCCWTLPMMTADGVKMINVPNMIKVRYSEVKKICAEYYSGLNDCFCDRTRAILVLADECENFIDETPLLDGSTCNCVYPRVETGSFSGEKIITLWESEDCDEETQTPINPKWIYDEKMVVSIGCADEYYFDNNQWNIWIEDKTETDTKGERIHFLSLRIDKNEGPSSQIPLTSYCESFLWKKSCDGDFCESKYYFATAQDVLIGVSDENIILSKDGNFWKYYPSSLTGVVAAASNSSTGGSTVLVLVHRESETEGTETVSVVSNDFGLFDGVSWGVANIVSSFPSCGKIAYGNSKFVTASKLKQGIFAKSMVSYDGISWSQHDMDAPYGADDIAWGTISGLGRYLAVRSVNSISGEPGTFQQFSLSPDGENWTSSPAPEFNRWKHVAYANGRFVVAGLGEKSDDPTWDGTSPVMAVSQNLINWTVVPCPINNVTALSSTDDEDSEYHFMIVGGYDSGFFAYGSDDGVVWELVRTPTAVPFNDFDGPWASSEAEGFVGNEYWFGTFDSLIYYRDKKWFAGGLIKSNQFSPEQFEFNKIIGWDGCWSYGKISPPEPYAYGTCQVDHPCFDGPPCPPAIPATLYLEDSSWRDENIDLATRYRREYGDYTLKETYQYKISHNLAGSIGSAFGVPESQEVVFDLEFMPTCREPDTASFCGGNCLGELYNFIDVETLDSYEIPAEECKRNKQAIYDGRPLDIDVTCGDPGEGEGDEVPGGVRMYFSPYTNTVPVINNFAYDTLSLPTPPPGKINVVLVKTTKTRNELRKWVCENLKFATVRNDWRENPVLGPGGAIGADFTSPEQNINFNWPYNDLYFSVCPGGNVVNLVPC